MHLRNLQQMANDHSVNAHKPFVNERTNTVALTDDRSATQVQPPISIAPEHADGSSETAVRPIVTPRSVAPQHDNDTALSSRPWRSGSHSGHDFEGNMIVLNRQHSKRKLIQPTHASASRRHLIKGSYGTTTTCWL